MFLCGDFVEILGFNFMQHTSLSIMLAWCVDEIVTNLNIKQTISALNSSLYSNNNLNDLLLQEVQPKLDTG